MAFCFSGSLLRANFSIVSLFFSFDAVIVRGKYSFLSFFLLPTVPDSRNDHRRRAGGKWALCAGENDADVVHEEVKGRADGGDVEGDDDYDADGTGTDRYSGDHVTVACLRRSRLRQLRFICTQGWSN